MKVNKIIAIIGLPGSGKTHLAKEMQKHLPSFEIIDDPSELFDFRTQLTNGNFIICDPHLCKQTSREILVKWCNLKGIELECIFFENDKDKCINNLRYRNDGRCISLTSFRYTIPKHIKTREIWQKES